MPPTCEVMITLGISQSGLSGGSGSCWNTSRPAPAIRLAASALSSASSSTTPPRALFAPVPYMASLVLQHLGKLAREREHEQERELRHLRSVETAGGGHQHLRRQVGQRRDVIGPGRQGLDEAQPRHGGDQLSEDLVVAH